MGSQPCQYLYSLNLKEIYTTPTDHQSPHPREIQSGRFSINKSGQSPASIETGLSIPNLLKTKTAAHQRKITAYHDFSGQESPYGIAFAQDSDDLL